MLFQTPKGPSYWGPQAASFLPSPPTLFSAALSAAPPWLSTGSCFLGTQWSGSWQEAPTLDLTEMTLLCCHSQSPRSCAAVRAPKCLLSDRTIGAASMVPAAQDADGDVWPEHVSSVHRASRSWRPLRPLVGDGETTPYTYMEKKCALTEFYGTQNHISSLFGFLYVSTIITRGQYFSS